MKDMLSQKLVAQAIAKQLRTKFMQSFPHQPQGRIFLLMAECIGSRWQKKQKQRATRHCLLEPCPSTECSPSRSEYFQPLSQILDHGKPIVKSYSLVVLAKIKSKE